MVKSGKRFGAIRTMVTRNANHGLNTTVEHKKIALKDAKKSARDIARGRIDRDDEAKEVYKNIIAKDEHTVIKSLAKRNTENRRKMTGIYKQLKEILTGPKIYDYPHESAGDETDETDDETNTTNMADLESEESIKKRRHGEGKGLKILTSNQMLSRLPIALA